MRSSAFSVSRDSGVFAARRCEPRTTSARVSVFGDMLGVFSREGLLLVFDFVAFGFPALDLCERCSYATTHFTEGTGKATDDGPPLGEKLLLPAFDPSCGDGHRRLLEEQATGRRALRIAHHLRLRSPPPPPPPVRGARSSA